jgi:hypothetical protein
MDRLMPSDEVNVNKHCAFTGGCNACSKRSRWYKHTSYYDVYVPVEPSRWQACATPYMCLIIRVYQLLGCLMDSYSPSSVKGWKCGCATVRLFVGRSNWRDFRLTAIRSRRSERKSFISGSQCHLGSVPCQPPGRTRSTPSSLYVSSAVRFPLSHQAHNAECIVPEGLHRGC